MAGVGPEMRLGRWLTDAEWERLVVRLREVFDARGTGHRLRLRTTKASARAGTSVGVLALGMGVVVSASAAAAGHLANATPGIIIMILTGLGTIASSVLPLPSWARVRGRQMDEIARALATPDETRSRSSTA